MEALRGRGSRGGREAVPARDITKRQVLRVRVLLGTPGAGLEMSWCIQKPPDAAQERQWRSRRLGPGACSRDAR